MEPWHRVVQPRKEVSQGRSFNPDEFAIHLEQVVSGAAPEDYRNPDSFFARTCFTRALTEHAGLVVRRLAGETEGAAPVLTLITQFGGGKTHTLTALYHLARAGAEARKFSGVPELLRAAGLAETPAARVAVFVGNAWDPQEGRETPWIDLARQIAGSDGVAALGPTARTAPPGTEAIGRVFQAGGGRVLILCDEVLNFMNRHRNLADPFYAFMQNLTGATTGTTSCAAVLSLPRSPTEMTDWDLQWQGRLEKVVRRVAKDLIVNDDAEISEVVRRRLFEDLGSERVRRNVCRAYAHWCFERRAQLPPEWTAVDTAATEKKSWEFLQNRFEMCYPFHPATLSVFKRKWQALPQYQQTRGTLAMLAQWVSWAYRHQFTNALKDPLITLGSAPLEASEFRSVVLGQLGEPRLGAAIEADIAGYMTHAKALDADTAGPLRDIHQRVGTAILFESTGAQNNKVAHLPELRFALGGPGVDTTSVDSAAMDLEAKAFFIRKVGSDGFQVKHTATIKKVMNDRRASLDEETDIQPMIRSIVQKEFERGASLPSVAFPQDGSSIQDSPRLMLVVVAPELEWTGSGGVREAIADWTRQRGKSPRLYPGALLWCVRKPGRELREKVELLLAWRRVQRDLNEGLLGADFDRGERIEVQAKVSDAEEAAKEEVWASYRFAVLADQREADGLKAIDLGAGHSSAAETLAGRVLGALKSEALLNESVGAGYLERNWPPALKASGAWPLATLRQCFVNGTLTRLVDPDAILRAKIVEFVEKGDFGLGSGQKADGTYERLWFQESIAPDEVTFEAGVFLVTKATARRLKSGAPAVRQPEEAREADAKPGKEAAAAPTPEGGAAPEPETRTLRVAGNVPPEMWNRVGTKVLAKLRAAGQDLQVGVDFQVTVGADLAKVLAVELRQVLDELGLAGKVRVE